MCCRRTFVALLNALIGGCALDGPAPYGQVVTMNAGEAAAHEGHPPPATIWRLDERDLKQLSPAPFVEPPPPPPLPPPPRPNDPPVYYAPPYHGPLLYWGPSFYYWGRW